MGSCRTRLRLSMSSSGAAAMAIAAAQSARPCERDGAPWYCGAADDACDSSFHSSLSRRHDRQQQQQDQQQDQQLSLKLKLQLELAHHLSSSSSSQSDSPSSSLLVTDLSWRTSSSSSSSSSQSHKRARTSWGKPHPHYSSLLSSSHPIKQEPPDHDSFLHDFPVPLPPFFDSPPSCSSHLHHDSKLLDSKPLPSTASLRALPTFFPVDPHLLLRTSSSASTSLGSDLLSSSSAEPDLSSDDVMSFVVPDHHHDYCDAVDSFLGDRFYEFERDMRSIMGETAAVSTLDVAHVSTNNNANSTIAAYELVVPKTEEDGSDSMSRDVTDFSPDTTSAELSEEEYRIDLTDFEPDESAADCSDVKPMQKICLRLNYEDVISAWSDRGSLWADGSWPQTSPEDCKLDLAAWELERLVPDLEMATEGMGHEFGGGGLIMVMEDGQSVVDDGCAINSSHNNNNAREARVMRYREKRRTRLFSKKIRYEVRKLNAERRPRMKGRFIKRTSD